MKIEKGGDQYNFHYGVEGEITHCTINGISSKFIEIQCSEANQHARWMLIHKDLEFAESMLQESIQRIKKHNIIVLDRRNIESVIIKSLIDSSIITYMKCFTQAHGRKVKFEAKDLFCKETEKDYLTHHQKVRELRDNSIAHAGISNSEGSKMFAVNSSQALISTNNPITVIAHSYFLFPELNFLDKTLKLIFLVKQKSHKKQTDRLNKFCAKVVNSPSEYGITSIL